MEPKLTFDIKTSRDFYNKMLLEYEDFCKNHLSVRYAINCAINSWHLTDWTFQEYFKDEKKYQDEKREKLKEGKIYVRIYFGLGKYQDELMKQCQSLKYMKLICNGSKHCILRDTGIEDKTKIHEGGFAYPDFDRHDYDVDRLVILDKKGQQLNFEDIFLETKVFWADYLKKIENR